MLNRFNRKRLSSSNNPITFSTQNKTRKNDHQKCANFCLHFKMTVEQRPNHKSNCRIPFIFHISLLFLSNYLFYNQRNTQSAKIIYLPMWTQSNKNVNVANMKNDLSPYDLQMEYIYKCIYSMANGRSHLIMVDGLSAAVGSACFLNHLCTGRARAKQRNYVQFIQFESSNEKCAREEKKIREERSSRTAVAILWFGIYDCSFYVQKYTKKKRIPTNIINNNHLLCAIKWIPDQTQRGLRCGS